MIKRKVADGLVLNSDGSGGKVTVTLPPIPEAFQGKTVSVYVLVQNTDSDARITMDWEHSCEGANWVSEGTALFDSGASTGISNGMNAPSSSTDITRCDAIRIKAGIQKTSGGSGSKKAMVTVWVIIKPF